MAVYRRILARYLDTNGDGTGTKNAIGDYSAGEELKIVPPNNRSFYLARILVHIEDDAVLAASKYGGLSALTNGISVMVKNAQGTMYDLTDGVPVKSNSDWGRLAYDVAVLDFGAGNNHVQVRWTFEKSGVPLRIDGGAGEYLAVVINDDLTGLVEHYFLVQGRDANRVA